MNEIDIIKPINLSVRGLDKKETQKCHCGKSLHYSDDALERTMKMMSLQFGEFMPVNIFTTDSEKPVRVFVVQRHYIALHGIDASTLPDLGFEELTVS